jgi:hypothetical protein
VDPPDASVGGARFGDFFDRFDRLNSPTSGSVRNPLGPLALCPSATCSRSSARVRSEQFIEIDCQSKRASNELPVHVELDPIDRYPGILAEFVAQALPELRPPLLFSERQRAADDEFSDRTGRRSTREFPRSGSAGR